MRYTLLLVLLFTGNVLSSNDHYILDLNGNQISKYDSSCELFKKIESVLKNKFEYNIQRRNVFTYYNIYEYFDIYLLKCQSVKSKPLVLFYNPVNDSISGATPHKAYVYYNKIDIVSINETKNMLEHILAIDNYNSSILDGWGDLEARQLKFSKVDFNDAKKHMDIAKPTILRYSNFDKHVFIVLSRPTKGTTIYRYEIKVKDKRILGLFTINELYCFNDSWGYE